MLRRFIPCLVIAIVFWSVTSPGSHLLAQSTTDDREQAAEKKIRYAIAIHGGAGASPKRFSDEANQRRHDSMAKALAIGTEILKKDGSSLDAVEAVIKFLENDPQFNAGQGAVYNDAGKHELDASIMDGRNGACGAVAGVTIVKNPIQLARMVMTDTRHVLLAGPGADQFARQKKVELVENNYFDTPATRRAWERRMNRKRNSKKGNEKLSWKLDGKAIHQEVTGSYFGTVGCVALDSSGNLAAGTSTGGLSGKQFGRVGDSPIVGAGTFANNKTCAISCTGIGEQFIRNAVAYDISAQMKYANRSLAEATDNVLRKTLDPGDGGIIGVGHDGSIVMDFNTEGMARAAADSSGKFEVLWHDSKKKATAESVK